jgi:capsular polysaccharide biosynthesis protein
MELLQIVTYHEACTQDASFVSNQQQLLSPEGRFLCPLPEYPIPELARPLFFHEGKNPTEALTYTYPARYLRQLPSARMVTSMYAVITHNHLLISDSYHHSERLEQTGVFKTRHMQVQSSSTTVEKITFALYQEKGSPQKLNGMSYLPFYYWHHNYHHWLLECLPLLLEYVEHHDPAHMKLLLPQEELNTFQKSALHLLEIPESALCPHPAEGLLCETLYVPDLGKFSAPQLKHTREYLLQKLQLTPQPTRKLYVSRQDATCRRVINEAELRPLLHAEGFEILYLENLSFTEQIQSFSEAAVIMGPHGAGLTNLLFAGKHTQIIELLPDDSINHCFWIMASALEQRYTYLTGSVQNVQRDFTVSPAALQQLLQVLS